jgi:hypothetical protein
MIKAYVKNNMLYVEAKGKLIPESSITRSEFILRIPLEEVEYIEYTCKQYVDPSAFFEWDFLKVKGNLPVPYATITICCKYPRADQQIPIIYYDLSIAEQDANMLVELLKQHNIID